MSVAPTDLRGSEITLGAKVAFNYSGMVGVGYVRRISESKRSYGSEHTFEIERETPKPRPGQNWMSKVTNPYNLLVLASDELI